MAEKFVQISSLPPEDRWGEAVPGEGTHCSNCEYLKDPEKMICGNEGFIAWNGSEKIPATDPTKYCSIWWELKEEPEEEFGGDYRYRPRK